MRHIVPTMRINSHMPIKNKFPMMEKIGCSACNHLGYSLDLLHSDKKSTVLEMCDCAKGLCNCEGERPYYGIGESESGQFSLEPCDIYPLHQKMDRIVQLFRQSELPLRFKYKFYNQHFEMKHLKDNNFRKQINSVLPPIWEGKKVQLPQGIFLHGRAGAGKTFLAAIIINELIFRHAIPSLFIKTTRSLNRIRQTFNVESDTYGQSAAIEELFRTIPVLVLDDLGAQKDSSWTDETLYDIIDTRYEEGLCSIVTSNKSLSELENLGEGRISSRLKEISEIIKFPDVDYREILQKHNSRS